MNLKLKKNIFSLTLATTLASSTLTGCNDNPTSPVIGTYYLYRNKEGIEVVWKNAQYFIYNYPNNDIVGQISNSGSLSHQTDGILRKNKIFSANPSYSPIQFVPLEEVIAADTIYYKDLDLFDSNSEEIREYFETTYTYPEIFHPGFTEKEFPCSLFEQTNLVNKEVTYNLGYQVKDEKNPSVVYDIPSGELVYFEPYTEIKITNLEQGFTVKEARTYIENCKKEATESFQKTKN